MGLPLRAAASSACLPTPRHPRGGRARQSAPRPRPHLTREQNSLQVLQIEWTEWHARAHRRTARPAWEGSVSRARAENRPRRCRPPAPLRRPAGRADGCRLADAASRSSRPCQTWHGTERPIGWATRPTRGTLGGTHHSPARPRAGGTTRHHSSAALTCLGASRTRRACPAARWLNGVTPAPCPARVLPRRLYLAC
jgi:hypothetical protein